MIGGLDTWPGLRLTGWPGSRRQVENNIFRGNDGRDQYALADSLNYPLRGSNIGLIGCVVPDVEQDNIVSPSRRRSNPAC